MPSVLTRAQRPNNNKSKFSTVLGLSHLNNDDDGDEHLTLPLPTPAKLKRAHRPLDQATFVHPAPAMVPRPIRLPAVAASQDGPWSVSVAETPNDPRASYSIYIRTPTHNITLTRSAHEIVDLHGKLRDLHPSASLPPLPIDSSIPPQKRRSSFLTTLSRFASSSSTGSRTSLRTPAAPPSTSQQTPATSPASELSDPFTSPLAALQPPQSTTTGLGSYLTTIANDPNFRSTRVWRKFVRVRTDDLESVRVERAIKRVRSDLAAHHATVPPQAGSASIPSSSSASIVASDGTDSSDPADTGMVPLTRQGIKEEDEEEEAVAEDRPAAETPSVPSSGPAERGYVLTQEPAEGHLPTPSPSPPSPSHHTIRIPRSASADPDKAARLSRVWKQSPSPLKQGADDTETEMDGEGDAETETSDKMSSVQAKRRPAKDRKSRKVAIDDFEMMRVLGKGCAGKVLLVRYKKSQMLYALKAITKRHVLAHQELQHTLTEQAVLKRMAHDAADPFVVKLHWSFHDKEHLFLVMDFHPGGDLATQLARWGRLGRDRARFYAAEIVEGVEGLHAMGVIYRDLKPENILIGADGHIVLTDFGLSKEFPRRSSVATTALPTAPSTPSARTSNGSDYTTSGSIIPSWMTSSGSSQWGAVPLQFQSPSDITSTFCGTAEYLAPEVIQGLPYSYEVDWWSFGTMLYEMLTGITPFWANNHSDMYVRVLQDELQFPDDRAMDQDTKSLIRGLLQRNPALRISEPRIKKHPYFSMIDWSHVYYKRYIPPYIPPIDPSNASDTQNFDDTFLDMDPTLDNEPEPESSHTDTDDKGERTDGEESVKTPPQVKSPHVVVDDGIDLFDGYSFKGRHSVILDGEEDEDVFGGHDAGSSVARDHDDVSTMPEETEPVGDGAATPHAAVPEEPAVSAEETQPAPSETDAAAAPPTSDLLNTPARKRPPPSPAQRSVDLDAELRNLAADASLLESDLTADLTEVAEAAKAIPLSAVVEEKPARKADGPTKTVTIVPPRGHHRKGRTERSGIAALDKGLDDMSDDDEASATEREDDDWDFIERPGGEEVNGQNGKSLFARGVVDRYRLAVWRSKASPYQPRSTSRNFSGLSGVSTADSDAGGSEVAPSPSPSEKIRRGRTAGLSLRKTKQFLRARSPTSTLSASASTSTSRSNLSQATSTTAVDRTGLLTPSPSVPLGIVTDPLLKMSTTSVSGPGSSSDPSLNGDALSQSAELAASPSRPSEQEPRQTAVSAPADTPEKPKPKKLQKYKEGAEKVLALFGSPR